jgi:hypothetical protein
MIVLNIATASGRTRGRTRSTLMMIEMKGPDIEAVDEVKALILESVNS